MNIKISEKILQSSFVKKAQSSISIVFQKCNEWEARQFLMKKSISTVFRKIEKWYPRYTSPNRLFTYLAFSLLSLFIHCLLFTNTHTHTHHSSYSDFHTHHPTLTPPQTPTHTNQFTHLTSYSLLDLCVCGVYICATVVVTLTLITLLWNSTLWHCDAEQYTVTSSWKKVKFWIFSQKNLTNIKSLEIKWNFFENKYVGTRKFEFKIYLFSHFS